MSRPPTIRDDLAGRDRTRSYDVRSASQQYSNIAGLLAGFAFTVIILVAQENVSSLSESEVLNRNIASIGFFVSFFGCILSSFVFALVSGEEALTPRANQMAFFAGGSFSLSISLLFWSISRILSAFFVEEISSFADEIFPLFIIIHPIFVIAAILDNIYIFDRRDPKPEEYLVSILPSALTILFYYWLHLGGLKIIVVESLELFYLIIKLFLFFTIIGNILSSLISTRDEYSRIPICIGGLWIWLQSLLIGFLIVLT